MFETVPYLIRGDVRVVGPENRRLEGFLAALQVECFLRLGLAKLEPFLRLCGEAMTEATGARRRLHHSGALRATSHEQSSASEVLAKVSAEIAPAT